MRFMDDIVGDLYSIAEWFYDIYYEVNDWVFPFNLIGKPFSYIAYSFYLLEWSFADFSDWVSDTANRIMWVLSWDEILDWIRATFPLIDTIFYWFGDWVYYVQTVVSDWWYTVENLVQGWDDAVRSWASDRMASLQTGIDYLVAEVAGLDNLTANLPNVYTWFSDWSGNVLGVVTSWWSGAVSEVQAMIDSAFLVREDLWTGWTTWRDQVKEFFTDPEDWLYKSIDRIVERFW